MKKDETVNGGFIFNKIHLYLNQGWNWKKIVLNFFLILDYLSLKV